MSRVGPGAGVTAAIKAAGSDVSAGEDGSGAAGFSAAGGAATAGTAAGAAIQLTKIGTAGGGVSGGVRLCSRPQAPTPWQATMPASTHPH